MNAVWSSIGGWFETKQPGVLAISLTFLLALAKATGLGSYPWSQAFAPVAIWLICVFGLFLVNGAVFVWISRREIARSVLSRGRG